MSASPVLCRFSYSNLPAAVAEEARGLADRLRAFERRTSEDAIALGLELIAVKAKLGHGNFGSWLSTEFPHGARTARNFMASAEAFGTKSATVSVLPPATMYRLASPAAEPIRAEIIGRLEKGEPLTPNGIEALVGDARRDAQRGRVRRDRATARKLRSDPAFRARFEKRQEREEKAQAAAREKWDAAWDRALVMLLDAFDDEAMTAFLGHLDEARDWSLPQRLREALAGAERPVPTMRGEVG